jgi:hypothetical protein
VRYLTLILGLLLSAVLSSSSLAEVKSKEVSEKYVEKGISFVVSAHPIATTYEKEVNLKRKIDEVNVSPKTPSIKEQSREKVVLFFAMVGIIFGFLALWGSIKVLMVGIASMQGRTISLKTASAFIVFVISLALIGYGIAMLTKGVSGTAGIKGDYNYFGTLK